MSIPYIPTGTTKRFFVPRTLAADFDAFLEQDIPNTVMDFEVIKNWYDKSKDDYEPRYVRGEIYPDSTKSRYEDTDNNMNIRCSVNSGIQKGNYLIQPNGEIFLLDWEVALESNNAPSRALRCNMMLKIMRHVNEQEEYDEDGFKMNDDSGPKDIVIVPSIPANAYRYDGRPEYVTVSGTPGATAGALTLMTVQYNEYTDKIHVDDTFDWGNETYRIVDVNRVGLPLHGNWGTLKLQARKAEGGLHGYE